MSQDDLPFRVIVAGGREMDDYGFVKQALDHLFQNKDKSNIVIVNGKARGADKMGGIYADIHGIAQDPYPANWYPDGPNGPLDRGAGYKRNELMADNADALVALWDGKSKGTKNMIDIARAKDLIIRIIRY